LGLDAEFEQFVTSRSVLLLRTAYLLTGDARDAEDVLQIALFRVARRWSSAREAPDAYARKAVLNVARDRHRRLLRRVRERPLADEGSFPSIGDHAEAVISRDEMIAALRRLPARQREVVVLRFFADLSVADTAAAMGASEGAVKSYTNRAMTSLRAVLGDDSKPTSEPRVEVPDAD
jgi:RNA polymerase sigma-70 factor (sigma-E family)